MDMSYVSRQPCFSGVRAHDVPAVVQDAELSRIDSMCLETNAGWRCTRGRYHRGWHVAKSGDHVCAWWAQDYPESLRVPEGM